jgi:hypothetical protein
VDKQTGGKCRRHGRTASNQNQKKMKTLTKLTIVIKKVTQMKKAILALVLFASVTAVNAQGYHWVNPHYDYRGNFYSGHLQGNPDGNPYNNLRYGGSYPYYMGY